LTALWAADAAAVATSGRTGGSWRAYGVSIDTRQLAAGDLFVALPGRNTDGHAFLDAAFAAGAAAALVRPQDERDDRYLEVDDPLEALQDLGRAARQRTKSKVVAVTGSVGKTGTKELIRAALAPLGSVHASASSHNNAIGVPLSLARMPAATSAAVFELGMNRAREIGSLVDLVRPDVALVTRIAPAHLEHFGSLDRIAEAKAEIFEGLKRGGTALIPVNTPGSDVLLRAARASGAARIVTFGTGEDADARLLEVTPTDTGSVFRWSFAGEVHRCRLRLSGAHWALNAVAAGCVADLLGVSPAESGSHMETVEPLAGRGRRHAVHLVDGEAWVIDDSYNANPASMCAALAALRSMPAAGRRLAVLGEMKELGRASAELHAGLAPALKGVDRVWCVGPEMAALHRKLSEDTAADLLTDAETAAERAASELRAGDVLLVKGSRANALETVVARVTGSKAR